LENQKERKKMRKPSFKTVDSKLSHYCRRFGMQLWNHGDGTYSLYDTKMQYLVLNRVDRHRVAIEVYACFNNC
jgi:hypothetical protein